MLIFYLNKYTCIIKKKCLGSESWGFWGLLHAIFLIKSTQQFVCIFFVSYQVPFNTMTMLQKKNNWQVNNGD